MSILSWEEILFALENLPLTHKIFTTDITAIQFKWNLMCITLTHQIRFNNVQCSLKRCIHNDVIWLCIPYLRYIQYMYYVELRENIISNHVYAKRSEWIEPNETLFDTQQNQIKQNRIFKNDHFHKYKTLCKFKSVCIDSIWWQNMV